MPDRQSQIVSAIAQLDPDTDEHWTSDGLPLVEAVASFLGGATTRKEITEAAPGLTREAAMAAEKGGPQEPPLQGAEGGQEKSLSDEPDVMTLPMAQVMRSLPLVEKALQALAARCKEAEDRKKAVAEELSKLHFQVDILTRQLSRLKKTDPKTSQEEHRKFLEQSFEARRKRAEAAKAFVKAGTTPDAVREQLEVRSKLDRVMASRKPAIGSSRPQMPLVGGA